MNPFIKSLQDAKTDHANRSRFNPKKRLRLTYVRTEPPGWPLKRPATRPEWVHVLRIMIMRRIPKSGPIHRTKLIRYVSADLLAASDAGKLYIDTDFSEMRMVYTELERLEGQAKIVRSAPRMHDPEMARADFAIYRTENADRWLSLIPVTVRAVVDYLPTTNVLDLMVQALLDDVEPDPSPLEPPPLSP